MNLFFHQLIVSAVLCWFAAISKHVKQLCSVLKSRVLLSLEQRRFQCFSAELQQMSRRKSKTLAPTGAQPGEAALSAGLRITWPSFDESQSVQ